MLKWVYLHMIFFDRSIWVDRRTPTDFHHVHHLFNIHLFRRTWNCREINHNILANIYHQTDNKKKKFSRYIQHCLTVRSWHWGEINDKTLEEWNKRLWVRYYCSTFFFYVKGQALNEKKKMAKKEENILRVSEDVESLSFKISLVVIIRKDMRR